MSRPKRNTEKVFVWLQPDVKVWLDLKCAELGLGKSGYFRMLLLQEMSRCESLHMAKSTSKKK